MVGTLTSKLWDKAIECNRRVYDINGISPTIMTHTGGNQDVKVAIEEPIICHSRGRNVENPSDRTKGIPLQQRMEQLPFRIRKLTPRETWRLMGFSDDDFDKASQKVSNSQLYKQSGNSIVVNVLMAIFGQMMPRES